MSEPIVDDITTPKGDELYLVRPGSQPARAGVLYLHWFDESPTANRGQFLQEATTLAEQGVASALPQLSFPWHSAPSDIGADLARIADELDRLRRAHALLAGIDGVDPTRIALVGHDFGAMHGMLLLAEVEAACGVLVAATPRWSDWFLPFWPISSDRYDYMRALGPLDPITGVASARCPLLFQFGTRDFYIAPMTGSELFRAAPEPKELLTYETDHAMEGNDIRQDRLRFVTSQLAL